MARKTKTTNNTPFDDTGIPTFKMSAKREKISLQALKEYKEGKTKPITDLDKYFDNIEKNLQQKN